MTEKGSFPPPPGRGLYREPAKAPPAATAEPSSYRLIVPPEYYVPLEAAKAPRPVVVAPESVWSRPPNSPQVASIAIVAWVTATLWHARVGTALVLPFACASVWLLVRSFRPSPPPWWVYLVTFVPLTVITTLIVVLG